MDCMELHTAAKMSLLANSGTFMSQKNKEWTTGDSCMWTDMIIHGTILYLQYLCVFRTRHAVAGLAALFFLVKVVSVGVTAAKGEAEALPVQRVVVPAGVARPTRAGVGGL